MDSSVDDGQQPKQPADMRRSEEQVEQCPVGNERNLTIGYRDDAVVHLLEDETVKVDKIARHMQGRNLPLPALHELYSRCEAADHQAALRRLRALCDQLLASTKAAGTRRKLGNQPLLLVTQPVSALQRLDEVAELVHRYLLYHNQMGIITRLTLQLGPMLMPEAPENSINYDTLRNMRSATGLSAMARFFFDVRDGGHLASDVDGVELQSVDAARAEATRALIDLARELLPLSDERALDIDIRDPTGEIVASASLTYKSRMR